MYENGNVFLTVILSVHHVTFSFSYIIVTGCLKNMIVMFYLIVQLQTFWNLQRKVFKFLSSAEDKFASIYLNDVSLLVLYVLPGLQNSENYQ